MQHPRPADSETLEVATCKLCFNQLSRLSQWLLNVGGHSPTGTMLWEKILLPECGNAGVELSSLSVWWVGSTPCLWSVCWRAVKESSRVVLWYLLGWQSLYQAIQNAIYALYKLILYVRQDRAHVSNFSFGAKANTCTSAICSGDAFWLTLHNLIAIREDLQIHPICEVWGLCICLVMYFPLAGLWTQCSIWSISDLCPS